MSRLRRSRRRLCLFVFQTLKLFVGAGIFLVVVFIISLSAALRVLGIVKKDPSS